MQPLHDIRDQAKVDELAQAMERDGWQGRPVLVLHCGNEQMALTGTHRIAAAKQAEISVPTYEVDYADYTDEQIEELVEARDDEDRLDALRDMEAKEAAALMAAEIEANRDPS